ncbi:hypothetical protein L332_02570 [Agrococcus pavilionensis RW1]|uniref:PknH-like extracellular domain-containing protein n=1 Tax=Agrococcus pavilionensis RW1 TaxID=1330458 RepID=U1MN89_9MICO|nr:hypothetical protein [Agrococcus pavilionensis]ERG63336.1 hypothetical protein L332_02570 [Agrococcus pavilionensis RW1]
MPRSTARRSPIAPLALAAAALLSVTGCVVGPPPPVEHGEPEPSLEPSPDASPDPSPSADEPQPGALPDVLELGMIAAEGALPGWETSIITDGDFEPQPDSDFPIGPTISVVETATGCTFWAYQGQQDSADPDEVANTQATLAAITGTAPGDWEADEFVLEPSASQGVSVVLLSIFSEADDGAVQAVYARNFQSSQTTSAIRAECGPDAGGIDQIDDVVSEHFQINFLLP